MAERTFSNQLVSTRPTNIHIVTTAAPAAGVESITTVPAGEYWKLATWLCTLTASGAAANRQPMLVIDDGSTTLWQWKINTAITSGQVVPVMAMASGTTGGNTSTAGNLQALSISLPDPNVFMLQPGWRVRTVTYLIDAADQWSAAKLVVDRFTV